MNYLRCPTLVVKPERLGLKRADIIQNTLARNSIAVVRGSCNQSDILNWLSSLMPVSKAVYYTSLSKEILPTHLRQPAAE